MAHISIRAQKFLILLGSTERTISIGSDPRHPDKVAFDCHEGETISINTNTSGNLTAAEVTTCIESLLSEEYTVPVLFFPPIIQVGGFDFCPRTHVEAVDQ